VNDGKTASELIDLEGKKLLIPVGGSRANIIQACKIKGVKEIHLLVTKSLFPDSNEILKLVRNLGFNTALSVIQIEGPEAGPRDCRDSILQRFQEMSDYSPDAIFVTGSTLLMVATICHIFPEAELIALRGKKLVSLSNGSNYSTSKEIDVDEYLAIHGLSLNKENRLCLEGLLLPAPPLDQYNMEGPKLTLTWVNWDKPTHKFNKKRKVEARAIGSTIKQIIDHVGIGAFNFNAYYFGQFILNSTNQLIVKSKPTLDDFFSQIEYSSIPESLEEISVDKKFTTYKIGKLQAVMKNKKQSDASGVLRTKDQIDRHGRLIIELENLEEL
tara:strand:+ start:2576 stop:3559 length:984 start_codon:yes stop_codon:yes gene_type:complete